jgi:hypothetical protein
MDKPYVVIQWELFEMPQAFGPFADAEEARLWTNENLGKEYKIDKWEEDQLYDNTIILRRLFT